METADDHCENNGREVLVLRRNFLGMSGEIEFSNGDINSFKVKNPPLVELSFYTEDKREVLSYGLDKSAKPEAVISILNMQTYVDKRFESKKLKRYFVSVCNIGRFLNKGI